MGAHSSIDWGTIMSIADRLGVTYAARMKWKSRNRVPHKWRRAIIMASDGALSWNDFQKMDGQK